MSFVALSYTFQQCKHCENQLRFDKVTESLKVGTFFEKQFKYVHSQMVCLQLKDSLVVDCV